MRSKILAMTVVSLGLVATPLALAQTTNSTTESPTNSNTPAPTTGGGGAGFEKATGSTGGEDGANYMTGPGVHLFYTDEGMSTLRPMDEVRTVYGGMSADDQLLLRSGCASNEDTRFADLCAAVGTF